MKTSRQKHIAVDLDGTLAEYNGWKGINHIGAPVCMLVKKLMEELEGGAKYSIFTARVSCAIEEVISRKVIMTWLSENELPLPVEITSIKHKHFTEFWDDRAKGVVPNTGFFHSNNGLFYSTNPNSKGEDSVVEDNNQTVPELLRSMANTFEKRNSEYKDNFKVVGAVMEALFPNGVELKTADDYNRWHIFELEIIKLTRFTNSGMVHKDSVHDRAIYAAMQETLITPKSIKLGNK